MNKSGASGRFSRECMAIALIMLLKEKNFDQISITDITEKAGVSRMAFYRNYSSKEEILLTHMEQIMNDYSEALSGIKSLTVRDVVRYVCENMKENIDIIESIVAAGLINNMSAMISMRLKKCYPKLEESSVGKYAAGFYIGGTVFIMRLWIENGMQEEPEEIAETICKLVDSKSTGSISSTTVLN